MDDTSSLPPTPIGSRVFERRAHRLPDTLGPWRLESRLDRGGMSDVYVVRHVQTGVRGALKTPRADRSDVKACVERFHTEVAVLSRLDHPGIVRVLDHDLVASPPWMVLELMEGGSLHTKLSGGHLPLHRSLEIAHELLDALAYAHAQGIVHRDVNPRNVLLDDVEGVKLCDFGVALVPGAVRPTLPGTAFGTVAYISPEQALDASAVGPATDVYGLGALLFTMLTGQSPLGLYMATPTSERIAVVPKGFRGVICQATALDPGQRFRSATSMSRALRRAATERLVMRWLPVGATAAAGMASGTAFSAGAAAVAFLAFSGSAPPPVAAPEAPEPVAVEVHESLREEPAPVTPPMPGPVEPEEVRRPFLFKGRARSVEATRTRTPKAELTKVVLRAKGATLKVDGEEVGRNRWSGRLAPGRHLVEVSSDSGTQRVPLQVTDEPLKWCYDVEHRAPCP